MNDSVTDMVTHIQYLSDIFIILMLLAIVTPQPNSSDTKIDDWSDKAVRGYIKAQKKMWRNWYKSYKK